MKRVLFAVLSLWAGAALSQISVEHPWARPTPPGAKLAAGYLTVLNAGAADRLVGASSPAAARVETHQTVKDGEVFRMRQVEGFAVPAKGRLELKPAGSHLMLIDIRRPFRRGEKVPVVLRFERAGEVKVELAVEPSAPQAGEGHHKH